MAGHNPQTQDLASILQTLSSFTTPTPPHGLVQSVPSTAPGQQGFNQSQQSPSAFPGSRIDTNYYDPKSSIDPSSLAPAALGHPGHLHFSHDQGQVQPIQHFPSQTAASYPAQAPGTSQPQARPTVPPLQPVLQGTTTQPSSAQKDPRTITTWPAALRHVSRLLATDDSALAHVRKLIESQHAHERAWWTGREEVLKRQRERGAGRAAIKDVLRAVGGRVSADIGEGGRDGPAGRNGNANANASTKDEVGQEKERNMDEEKELMQYDRKVHRACGEMVRAMERELEGLGVPAFGIRKDLVLEDVVDGREDERRMPGSGKITRSELRALQKRILEHLEDMCKE